MGISQIVCMTRRLDLSFGHSIVHIFTDLHLLHGLCLEVGIGGGNNADMIPDLREVGEGIETVEGV